MGLELDMMIKFGGSVDRLSNNIRPGFTLEVGLELELEFRWRFILGLEDMVDPTPDEAIDAPPF